MRDCRRAKINSRHQPQKNFQKELIVTRYAFASSAAAAVVTHAPINHKFFNVKTRLVMNLLAFANPRLGLALEPWEFLPGTNSQQLVMKMNRLADANKQRTKSFYTALRFQSTTIKRPSNSIKSTSSAQLSRTFSRPHHPLVDAPLATFYHR
jgi:hypothetical protein